MDIPVETRRRQELASRPTASSWVSANAGSGKTFVLARRVVRLLLAGTDPARILCLTFTKAAAAEMASRVFNILSEWTVLDDPALATAIEEMGEGRPDRQCLARARRLFASALETPGGLKIQTIHGFCEGLLHQFPLEANVAGHFTVLDDRTQDELMGAARARVLGRAAEDPSSPMGRALRLLIDLMPDMKVESAVAELIGRRDDLYRWMIDAGSLANGLSQVRAFFHVGEEESLERLQDEVLGAQAINEQTRLVFADAYRLGGATDVSRANLLERSVRAEGLVERREAYASIFTKKDGGRPKALATKAIAESYPDMVERIEREADRFQELGERRKAIVTVQGTGALLQLADAVLQGYEREKGRRGLLDFEDLVVKTANLLSRSDASQWVQYKLDQGLDHILVDEAQDTSPRQWQVIRALAEEFFVGEGARQSIRTVFAVGDEKQSIYSFQGAVPAYFAAMRQTFDRKARDASREFHDVRLTLSFRSTPDVLGAVDKVFSEPYVRRGLSQEGEAPVHEAVRRADAGLVEIWPMEVHEPEEENDDWLAPLDRLAKGSPMLRVAERIADRISEWIRNDEVSAGDVLVLLRKRGPFVDALNRALKLRCVPVAGADRLVLNDHIAVKDLVALGRFLLLVDDDLSLAAVLKSPLFGLEDDDLFTLSYKRPGTLWRSLVRAASQDPRYREAHETLERWRARADYVPPYEFFSRLLGPDGGRRRMRARLGGEVDDILDEFLTLTLSFESTGVPGMEGFLAWLTAAPTQIKREMEGGGDAVRIMTVHGAKGLEAENVFLVDPGSKPVVTAHDPAFLPLSTKEDASRTPALVWLPTKADRTAWHEEVLDEVHAKSEEEYRRLLYVALTRAKDRLVVCGWEGKRGAPEGCWHELVTNGLAADAQEVLDADGKLNALLWQRSGTTISPVTVRNVSGGKSVQNTKIDLPEWIRKRSDPPETLKKVAPSRALDLLEGHDGVEEPAPRLALDSLLAPEKWGLVKGRLVHRLLQSLPDISVNQRKLAADRYLDDALPESFADRRSELLAEVNAVLEQPDFSEFLSPRARAEVPLAGTLLDSNSQAFAVSGQIDRLVVLESEVLILDYKTNARPPGSVSSIPPEYVAQLAIYRELMLDLYPHHKIRAFLLWTASSDLMEVPENMLERIVRAFADREDRVA